MFLGDFQAVLCAVEASRDNPVYVRVPLTNLLKWSARWEGKGPAASLYTMSQPEGPREMSLSLMRRGNQNFMAEELEKGRGRAQLSRLGSHLPAPLLIGGQDISSNLQLGKLLGRAQQTVLHMLCRLMLIP